MTWQYSIIALDGTHHLDGVKPLYHARFDQVLKFHTPGLAPVRRGNEAWHIYANGSAAYTRRFQQTFGFYQGIAAVHGPHGWQHIQPDGSDLYNARYAWCGNYQNGRCAVRGAEGGYLHLALNGSPAYKSRWKYAGDFRDGIAVVQSTDGRSSHINHDGTPIHDQWFHDLDVFHKGLARARDDAGWMHIDLSGRTVYARRFAAVEPFYNGQARVERWDGGLEVIDDTGSQILTLRSPRVSEFASLSADLVGFWKTQTICAAVEIGIFESLPNAANAIATKCQLDTHRTLRMLRALAELNLVQRRGKQWYATPRGMYLNTQSHLTLADAAIEYGREFTKMWANLPDAMGTETTWTAPDIFSDVASDPDRIVSHHRMLLSYARHDYRNIPKALELQGHERIIDAGGGIGELASILVKYHPNLFVTILERPEVVALAQKKQFSSQVNVRSVDLFQPWDIYGDAVVLARILHDWPTQKALQIMRHARSTLKTGDRVFIIEMVMLEDSVSGGLCDLHLLMATGGAERTLQEYRALLNAGGFRFEKVVTLNTVPSIIVGIAK